MDGDESSPPSPPRRYEFAETTSPNRNKSTKLSTQRVKSLLRGSPSFDDDNDVSSSVNNNGITIVSVEQKMPFHPSYPHQEDKRISSKGESSGDSHISFESLSKNTKYYNRPAVSTSSNTVVSDLSASVGRSRNKTPPGSPGRSTDCDSKNTSGTLLSTFLESLCDGVLNFCADGNTGGTAITKDERKNEAEETFLGKMITCHRFDVDDFGCAADDFGCASHDFACGNKMSEKPNTTSPNWVCL